MREVKKKKKKEAEKGKIRGSFLPHQEGKAVPRPDPVTDWR